MKISEASSQGEYIEEDKEQKIFKQVSFAWKVIIWSPRCKDVSEDLKCTWDSNGHDFAMTLFDSELSFAKETFNPHCLI